MTVSYTFDLSVVNFTTVFKLLIRWKGSILKVVSKEGLAYFTAYAIINIVYRWALDKDQRLTFDSIANYCMTYMGMIPTSFILGFYVSIVFTRWNALIDLLPWIDTPSMFLSSFVQGDIKSRLYRRTILRYMVAGTVMAYRNASMQVRKRFPTFQHIVDSGLLTPAEGLLIQGLDSRPGDAKQWAPFMWANAIVMKARAEGRISGDVFAESCIREINVLRAKIGDMMVADSVCIPLVYTQVVTLAVWTYFIASLFANQIWMPSDATPEVVAKTLDLYIPIFTIVQFVCYVGWLRVAQDMLNPLGEADDDFELNAILDRNLQVGLLMMDQNAGVIPDLGVDAFIDEDVPILPHTDASKHTANSAMVSSVGDVVIPKQEQQVADTRHNSNRSSFIGNLRRRSTRLNTVSSDIEKTGEDSMHGSIHGSHGGSMRKSSSMSEQLKAKLSAVIAGATNNGTGAVVEPPNPEPTPEEALRLRKQSILRKHLETVNEDDEAAGGDVFTSESGTPQLMVPEPLKPSEVFELELMAVEQRESAAFSPAPAPSFGLPEGRTSSQASLSNSLRRRTTSEPPVPTDSAPDVP